MRDAHWLAGTRLRPLNPVPCLAVPVMTHLLALGARRGVALETSGFDLPGRRAVLIPVPDTRNQCLARLLIPLFVLTAVVIAWLS